MTQKLLYGIVFLLMTGLMACNNASRKQQATEQPAAVEQQQQSYYNRLTGTLGTTDAVLQLVKYQSRDRDQQAATDDCSRGILTVDTTQPMQIAGYVNADSAIVLVTYDHYTPVDTLVGQFTAGVFEGRFTDTSGTSQPFQLQPDFQDGSYHWQVATHRDSLVLDSSLTDSPKGETDLLTLWPSDDMPVAARKQIADTLSQSFFGMHQSYTQGGALLQAASDTFLQRYDYTIHEMLRDDNQMRPSFNWNLLTYMDVLANAKDRVSLRFTRYDYTGGAHGMQSVFCLNVDTKTGAILRLSDLFKPGFEQQLQEMLEAELRQQYDIPQGEPLNGEKGLLFDPHLPVSKNFYLTQKGIGFVYNPYEVAAYVVGEINLYVPFARIADLMVK